MQQLNVIAGVAGFAAQSLLAALGSIQFASNVLFAWFVLHERVRSCAPVMCHFRHLQADLQSSHYGNPLHRVQ